MTALPLAPRPIQWGKRCFVYCGPERCDCDAAASPWQRELHEEELKTLEEAIERNKKDAK